MHTGVKKSLLHIGLMGSNLEPHLKRDIAKPGKVQKRATIMARGLKQFPYGAKLKSLGLFILAGGGQQRRERGRERLQLG